MIYPDIHEKLIEFNSNVSSSMEEIFELDISSKGLLKRYLSNQESFDNTSLIKLQAVIDYMYEQVNIGNWKEVKVYLRKTITIASYLKLISLFKCTDESSENVIKDMFKIIDFGILFGTPLDSEPQLLQKCADVLQTLSSKYINVFDDRSNYDENLDQIQGKYDGLSIDTLDCPSMEYFLKNHILAEKPAVLKNCINHWPALSKWKDRNYFIQLAGLRTVSVELGRDYTDSDWTQKLMTVEEFVKSHIYQVDGTIGYLAQYQLFEQIPELKSDIEEPEYCCFSETDDSVDIMAWYGPKGTVSPLHHDPKRNLLAQVVGKKQMFLFSPKDSEFLYPHGHELLNNTARIDPRKPNYEKFPKYKDAKPYYCVLSPGQMLYIPPKWWHFVESLSVSFSVSFWWE